MRKITVNLENEFYLKVLKERPSNVKPELFFSYYINELLSKKIKRQEKKYVK